MSSQTSKAGGCGDIEYDYEHQFAENSKCKYTRTEALSHEFKQLSSKDSFSSLLVTGIKLESI